MGDKRERIDLLEEEVSGLRKENQSLRLKLDQFIEGN